MAGKTNGYVLSESESRYLRKAFNLQENVLRKYIHVDEAELKKDTMQVEMLQAVSTAFKDRHISCETIQRLFNRLQRVKYWSLILTHVVSAADESKRTATYEIISNQPEINGRTVQTDELAADFFTLNALEQAEILHIPDNTLYIEHTELTALSILQPICLYESGQTVTEDADFWKMKSSPLLDVFSGVGNHALTGKELQEDSFGGGNMYEIVSATGVRVYIDKEQYSQLLFTSPNMDKLIKQLNHKAYVNGFKSKTVTLTLDEIQEARGARDRRELDKSVRAALNGLFAISLTYEREDSTGKEFKKRRIIQEADGREGHGRGHSAQYSITYTDAYFNHLRSTPQVVQLPTEILKIPNNKPHAYSFATAFYEQKRRNIGKAQGIENKLAVKTLLNYSSLPSYDKLKDKAQAAQLIIDPFLKAFDYLEEQEILTYELQHSAKDARGGNGITLTDEELDRVYRDYAFFSSLIVKVIWRKEPDYSNLLAAKRNRLEQANKPKRGRPKAKKK